MSNASDTAEAILIVIKRILKWIVCTIAVLIGTGAIVAAGYYFHRYYTYDLPKSQVATNIQKDEAKCPGAFFVSVENNSDRTIETVTLYLAAHKPGHSTNLAGNKRHQTDRIIPPGEGYGWCANPFHSFADALLGKPGTDAVNGRNLVWSIDVVQMTFRE